MTEDQRARAERNFSNRSFTVFLYFPIYTENRESLQSYLREHGIYAPVLWPIGKANEKILNEQEKFIYSSLLALPMDARYGEIEMLKVIDTIKQFDQMV